MSRACRLFLWVLFLVAGAGPALAQTGRILGTVSDSTGAVIPSVTVTVTSQETKSARTFLTDNTGNYDFPGLPVGNYTIRAELAGFKTAETQMRVEIGQIARQNLQLAVGEVADVVQVLAEAPLLQADNVEIGQVVTNRQIIELPLNGRNFTTLALLVPGVTTRGGGLDSFGEAGTVSVNGSRGGAENYMVEGVTTNASNTRQPQIAPSVESIQEFKIQSSTYNAEFGRGAAEVNLITKSGTNSFRGVVYDFWRNNSLAANDFFQNQLPNPDSIGSTLNRHQFGVTYGGPIFKNQTFFFSNYEGQRVREGRTVTYRVPTDLERAGDFSRSPGVQSITDPETGSPFPDSKVPASRFHSAYKYFQGWWPSPNTTDGFLISAPKNRSDSDQVGVRVDHNFSKKDTLFVRYFRARRDLLNPGVGTEPGLLENIVVDVDSRQWAGHYTHSFSPNLLVDFQYSRLDFNSLSVVGPNCFQEDNCTNHVVASGIQNMDFTAQFFPGAPQLAFGAGGWAQLLGTRDPLEVLFPTDSWRSELTWIKGKHTMKGGIDFYAQDGLVQIALQSRGVFSMTGARTSGGRTPWSDFMLGQATQPARAIPTTKTGINNHNFHYFIQDDWKIHPRLTLNLGLRYEYNLFPTATNGGGSVDPKTGMLIFADLDGDGTPNNEAEFAPGFDLIYPLVKDSLVPNQDLGLDASMIETDKNNFAPRFGLAWRPFGDRTVVRAGYGIYYGTVANGNIGESQILMPPFSVVEVGASGSIDNAFPRVLTQILPGTWQAFALDSNQQWPYDQQFSLTLQHSLANDLILESGYVGRTGTHLVSRSNLAMPASRPSFVPPTLVIHDADSTSNFHSWQTRLEKRYSSGLAFSLAYTWSKSMDRSSEDRDTGGIDSGFNRRAASDHDIPQRFVSSVVWDLPFGYGRKFLSARGGFVDAVLGGWQWSAIAQFQSGHPFHPVWATGSNSATVATARIPNRIGNGELDNPTPQRWFDSSAFAPHVRQPDPSRPGMFLLTEGNSGRNILRSDGMANWDIGIMKNFYFRERYRVQFRGELFNTFNHVQFAPPGACAPNCLGRSRPENNPQITGGPNDGRVFQTNSIPRQIQFGLKLFF